MRSTEWNKEWCVYVEVKVPFQSDTLTFVLEVERHSEARHLNVDLLFVI